MLRPTAHAERPGSHASRPSTSGGSRSPSPWDRDLPSNRRAGSPSSPKRSGSPTHRRRKPNAFRAAFDAGKLPLTVERFGPTQSLEWTKDPTDVDLSYLLPLLIEGVALQKEPYFFAASEGLMEILEACGGGDGRQGSRLASLVPDLVPPIRAALNRRDERTSFVILRALQSLVVADPRVLPQLQKHYRAILPSFNILRTKSQWFDGPNPHGKTSMPNAVQETLEIMEMHGDEGGFREISRFVPSYKSCLF
jgi:hypothetical protein